MELTTLPPSCGYCLEIWEPQHPGNLRASWGLYKDCFTRFTYIPSVGLEISWNWLHLYLMAFEYILCRLKHTRLTYLTHKGLSVISVYAYEMRWAERKQTRNLQRLDEYTWIHYRGADKSLAWPERKQDCFRQNGVNFLRRLALQKKKNLTARVSVLLKSRASLTCFRACFLPGQAKDFSTPR